MISGMCQNDDKVCKHSELVKSDWPAESHDMGEILRDYLLGYQG